MDSVRWMQLFVLLPIRVIRVIRASEAWRSGRAGRAERATRSEPRLIRVWTESLCVRCSCLLFGIVQTQTTLHFHKGDRCCKMNGNDRGRWNCKQSYKSQSNSLLTLYLRYRFRWTWSASSGVSQQIMNAAKNKSWSDEGRRRRKKTVSWTLKKDVQTRWNFS